MAEPKPVAFAALVFHRLDLGPCGSSNQLAFNEIVGQRRLADRRLFAVIDKKNVEIDFLAVFFSQKLDVDDIAFFNFVLFTTSFDNGVHD